MTEHPGGRKNTIRLFELAELPEGSRVLDAGAGTGESHCSVCVDIEPRGENVIKADFLDLPFEDCSFDAVLSECSFYASGDQRRAVAEAYRVLRPGGKLLLADIFYEMPELKGFEINNIVDITEEWKNYYFSALWSGENVAEKCGSKGKKGSPKYFLIVAERLT